MLSGAEGAPSSEIDCREALIIWITRDSMRAIPVKAILLLLVLAVSIPSDGAAKGKRRALYISYVQDEHAQVTVDDPTRLNS